jgi:hypothetical protein
MVDGLFPRESGWSGAMPRTGLDFSESREPGMSELLNRESDISICDTALAGSLRT